MALPKETRLIDPRAWERKLEGTEGCFHNAATLCRIYEARAANRTRAVPSIFITLTSELNLNTIFLSERTAGGFIGWSREDPITRRYEPSRIPHIRIHRDATRHYFFNISPFIEGLLSVFVCRGRCSFRISGRGNDVSVDLPPLWNLLPDHARSAN